MFIACLLLTSIAAQAQFEKGKWVVNPAVTGFELSHSKFADTTFGLQGQGGAFVMDNVALMLTAGGLWTDSYDIYTLGVGGRYYFNQSGVYTGAGLGLNKIDPDNIKSETFWSLNTEVGYAFFITKTITIEPAVFCNFSFKNSDYTEYGLKVGFGIYF